MTDLLKISELAARAGVEKSTIQHYLREGLIPAAATRPHRNMHYYDAGLVARIKLIKDLQVRGNLPLAQIRQLLTDEHVIDEAGIEQLRATLLASSSALDLSRQQPVSRARLIEESGIEADVLDRLEQRGFIASTRKGNATVYDPVDVAIVHACASMQRAGLNKQNGFQLEDLDVYLHTTRDLIGKEMTLFARVLRNRSTEEIVELARRGLEGTNTLLLNLRRKMFLRILEDARPSPNRGATRRRRGAT